MGKNPSWVRIEDEMRISYLDYAMSVIIGRALPDVRDGLKPVHRRILYAMYREGLLHNKKFSKCAGVVGEVLKKYHPHGDSAVYDTLVRMAQPWNMRYPLIEGQGNFGSIDGDSAAAYRYTESRLQKLTEWMLKDIDKDTVDFAPNFDGTTTEPTVLPTRFPSLLANGSDGIAVGMATKIPPHNLGEVIDACLYLLENPDATVEDLVLGPPDETGVRRKPILPGPDFPTGGIVKDRASILNAYKTGKDVIQIQARADIESSENKNRIVIKEVPYQVNKSRLIEKIVQLVKEKKIEGISDIRDESNREGIRIVVELKRDAFPEIVLNQLYKHSPLQHSFGIILLAIVEGQPKLLNLRELLLLFLEHRREVVIRRCRYELKKAEEKAHILQGLERALENIDRVIEIIRGSKSTDEAKGLLEGEFQFSQPQLKAILELRLQKLTALEREQLAAEHQKLREEIKQLTEILNSEEKLKSVIRDELLEVKELFGDDRLSEIAESSEDFVPEDLIADEEMVVTLTYSGYIKRNPLSEYRVQRRGGRGVQGAVTKDNDFISQLFVASTHTDLLVFTNAGKVYQLKVYKIPLTSRNAMGRPIVNLIDLEEGESPTAILPIREYSEGQFIFFTTRRGIVKKTDLKAFSTVRSNGLRAINLDEGDEVIGVGLTDGSRDIMLCSRNGKVIRFSEEQVRPMGRTARGVTGIKLDSDDEVVSLVIIQNPENYILTATENGYGKLTPISEYRITARGGKGIITIKTTQRNGKVAGILEVSLDDQIMFISDAGKIIRTWANEIRMSGRNTQGIRIIRLADGEKIASFAKVVENHDESDSPDSDGGGEGADSPDRDGGVGAAGISEGEGGAEVSDSPDRDGGGEVSDSSDSNGVLETAGTSEVGDGTGISETAEQTDREGE